MPEYYPYVTVTNKIDLSKLWWTLEKGLVFERIVVDARWFSAGAPSSGRDLLKKIIKGHPEMGVIVDPKLELVQLPLIHEGSKELGRDYNREFIKRLLGEGNSIKIVMGNYTVSDIEDWLGEFVEGYLRILREASYKDLGLAEWWLDDVVVAPYFVSMEYGDEWYEMNLELVREVVSRKSGKAEVVAAIPLDLGVLSEWNSVSMVRRDYRELNVQGYYVLPYRLSEYSDDVRDAVHNLLWLVLELGKTGRRVMVHAGGLAAILFALGVDVVVSGLCNRSTPRLKPSGGGGMSPDYRFYVHVLFNKMDKNRLQALVRDVLDYSCECPACKKADSPLELVENNDYRSLALHYAYWKKREAEEYFKQPGLLSERLREAQKIASVYQDKVVEQKRDDKERSGLAVSFDYLGLWIDLLKIFSQRDSASS